MLREMDHSSLPLDAQCHAAEEELGQRVRVDRLLLVRSPQTTGRRIPRTGSLKRHKCTASNGSHTCGRNTVRWKKSWGSASAWIVSSSSDLPRTAGSWFPRTGSPERRKCTASNDIRACRRNTVRRTAWSDHTVGSEWQWLCKP